MFKIFIKDKDYFKVMNISNTAFCFTYFIIFRNELIFRIAKRILYSLFAAKSQPQLVERRLTRRGTRRGSSGQKDRPALPLGLCHTATFKWHEK